MNVLGTKILGHDPGAALIASGRVIAISEERLCRVKYAPDVFPALSIRYCLDAFGLDARDIDLIVIDSVKFPREDFDAAAEFVRRCPLDFPNAKIRVANHHETHAASAFFASPFEEAAVLVSDGRGEHFYSHLGLETTETETPFYGKKNKFYQIQKTTHDARSTRQTGGVGMMYSYLSERYVRLGRFSEGKMMGLASYGSDEFLKKYPIEMWYKEKEGHLLCNFQFYPKMPPLWRELRKVRNGSRLVRLVAMHTRRLLAAPYKSLCGALRAVFLRNKRHAPRVFRDKIYLSEVPRPDTCALPDSHYASVAYAGQKVLESVMLRWAQKLFLLVPSRNLAMAGGVALNIDANRRIWDESGFKNLFIQPAATDSGIPLGCALYGWHMILDQPRFFTMQNASLGKSYEETHVRAVLERHRDHVIFKRVPRPEERAAELIAEGSVVGWFQGGSEYGPRALGYRSILCDPRREDMKDIVNKRVKHREWWRPFAASVLRERMSDFFDLDADSPFMLLSATVHKEKVARIPSVVHVDGTTRLQTVTKEANGSYYDLINFFFHKTGVPLILNTSFNLGGDPIVETPDEAMECFLHSAMDYLFIDEVVSTFPHLTLYCIGIISV